MRICFFNDIQFLGGGEIWVLRACRYLRTAGHSVSVVCPRRSELQFACQREGIDVFAVDEPHRFGRPFHSGLRHFLQELQIDLLYCTVMGNFCEALALEQIADRINAERADNKLALILKSGLPPMGELTAEYYGLGAGPAVRRLHVVAENLREAFVAWQPALAEGFLEVQYEGIDATAFQGVDRAQARARWDLPEGHVVITCLARLVSDMKGQSVLLRAAPALLAAHPNTTFLIAGDGKDRELLEELCADLRLDHAVRFLGHVEDVAGLLAATDILCHPSLHDGLPNSIVEALAVGTPVVASRLGGIPEILEDRATGLLVRPNDVLGLEKALRTLLDDPAERTEMGARGWARVRDRFDLHANLDRLADRLADELAAFRAAPLASLAPPLGPQAESLPVLFLMNVLRTGGEETELVLLARHLDKRRFPMSVLTLWETDEASMAVQELTAWGIPIDRACVPLEHEHEKTRYIVDKIRRDRIGIVVACHDTRIAYRVFERLSPEECRLIEHGGIVGDVDNAPKDRTARYVGVSPQIAAAAAPLLRSPDHAVFLPSMVDPSHFEAPDWAPARAYSADWLRTTALEPNGFGPDVCVITFVGRLDPKKRVEDLIEAARNLEADCPNAFFLIVGGKDGFEPAYEKRLRSLAADLVQHGRLLFTGPRGDVPGLLVASHILVLPSTGEGMAHVINEAGAASLAVVATIDGAAPEQLEHGSCGVLVETRNVDQLSAALRALIADPERRRLLGARLRAKVHAEYAAPLVVEQWHALFADVQQELGRTFRRALGMRPGPRQIAPDLLPDFPAEIQIQTNTACNATCIMCPHPEVKMEVSMGRMDESLYQHILAECADAPNLHRIEPFLMNEPFTDTRIVDWIALAKRRAPHADLTVTTNGALLTPDVADRLVTSGLDAIWFSFNGVEPETYEQIMGIPQAQVVENIDYLLSIRPSTLKVCVNMIETKPMAPEIARNIAAWVRKGVEAGASPLVNRAGNVERYTALNYRPVSDRPIRVCELVFYKMYVLYNGDVVLCCMDWRRQVVLGNLRRQSIREIWHGPAYERIREKLIQRDTAGLALCSTCSYPLT